MVVLGVQGQPRQPRTHAGDVRGGWDSGWYHDAAAVLMIDGVVVAAIEEERLSRCKHTGKLPLQAMRACLEVASCSARDVDLFAFGEEGGSGAYRDSGIDVDALAALLEQEFGSANSPRGRIRTFEHHICHAMSAYALSGYSDSLIFTADGFGDGVSGYVMEAHGKRLELLDQIEVADSLGALYQAALPLLGFGAHDEFKMMGLAPYGNPATYRQVFGSAYRLHEHGRFSVDRRLLQEQLAELGAPRRCDDAFSARDCDIAAAAQTALEEVAVHLLSYHRDVSGVRRLSAAGGVMQNCALNGRLVRSGLFDHVFIQPAAGDCGLALGAACLGYLNHAGNGAPRIAPQSHVFLGRPVPKADGLARQLQRWEGFLTFRHCDDIAHSAARLLSKGMVIGWVQGRAEFGPRALGNRSILADPRDPANKDRINSMVKKREAFRPFAPAVRSVDASLYFDLPAGTDCSFMTVVVPVRKEFRQMLGAVTHVDGTARVQVVQQAHNPLLWRLLEAFGAECEIPVLLNTSFNNNHEPIVDSVDDAVACFLTTGLDALAIGPFLVEKNPLWGQHLDKLQPMLVQDACLATGFRILTDGRREQFHVILTASEQVQISAGVYLALSEQRIETMDPALAAELLKLWELRVVQLLPA